MNINNYYNFKNPIRHFIDIEKISLPFSLEDIEIDNISWSHPINFRIKKIGKSYRMLKMPNMLNFMCAYNKFKSYQDFNSPNLMHSCKRLVPNLRTGDFATGIYDSQLESDFQELCIYDNLLKLDIKSYYGRIYTHHIDFESNGDERYLSNLNMGNSNGLIMGNYLSLYFAEKYLVNIINDLDEAFRRELIDCKFSHFSDDFYFFCYKQDNSRIIRIFENVLENYNLERNPAKEEIWSYLDYNEYNKVEKYWKKIISESKFRFLKEEDSNKLYFINQLIYRLSKLEDEQLQKIFVLGFFKSTYFQNLDISKYSLEEYNQHQLCYIFKFCPEVMIYSLKHFSQYEYFRGGKFKEYLTVRYKSALYNPYHEEQLYYYFAIKLLNFDSILKEYTHEVYESKNQVLISYYLKDNLFEDNIIDKMKNETEEMYWFQNYHLILYTNLSENLEESIKKFLIPKYAQWDPENEKKRSNNLKKKFDTYLEFYKHNLELSNPFIKSIEEICASIEGYINLKKEEREDIYGTESDFDSDLEDGLYEE